VTRHEPGGGHSFDDRPLHTANVSDHPISESRKFIDDSGNLPDRHCDDTELSGGVTTDL
jgi:hypothetical protein